MGKRKRFLWACPRDEGQEVKSLKAMDRNKLSLFELFNFLNFRNNNSISILESTKMCNLRNIVYMALNHGLVMMKKFSAPANQ
jgi:hypothetical protein